MSSFMELAVIAIAVGLIGLIFGVLMPLAGVRLGIVAVACARRARGGERRLLLLVGHHLVEPALTTALVLARFGTLPLWQDTEWWMWTVPSLSLLTLLLPAFFWGWETPELAERCRQLALWGAGRVVTCLACWAALPQYAGPAQYDIGPLPFVAVVGLAILAGSIVGAYRTLDALAAPAQPQPATT